MPKLSVEQSEQIAFQIQVLNQFAFSLDVEYLKALVKEQRNQASMYDSAAVLNRAWNPNKAALLHAYADTLQALVDYIEANMRVTEAKKKVEAHDQMAGELSKLFE